MRGPGWAFGGKTQCLARTRAWQQQTGRPSWPWAAWDQAWDLAVAGTAPEGGAR